MQQNTLTIRIPGRLRATLNKISKNEHKPISNIVRDSLRQYIAIHEFRALRKKVLPFAEAQGLLTDDDIFECL